QGDREHGACAQGPGPRDRPGADGAERKIDGVDVEFAEERRRPRFLRRFLGCRRADERSGAQQSRKQAPRDGRGRWSAPGHADSRRSFLRRGGKRRSSCNVSIANEHAGADQRSGEIKAMLENPASRQASTTSSRQRVRSRASHWILSAALPGNVLRFFWRHSFNLATVPSDSSAPAKVRTEMSEMLPEVFAPRCVRTLTVKSVSNAATAFLSRTGSTATGLAGARSEGRARSI